MFVNVPTAEDTVVAMLRDASHARAFIQEEMRGADDSIENEQSYALHVRDRTKDVDRPSNDLIESDRVLGTACMCWWALQATSSLPAPLALTLTRKRDVLQDDSEMEMFTVGDAKLYPVAPATTVDEFIQAMAPPSMESSNNKKAVQVLQASTDDVYFGLSSSAPVVGHLTPSVPLSPLSVLNDDPRSKWFLSPGDLAANLHVDFTSDVYVVSVDLFEAAIVAVALVLAGHPRVHLCSFGLRESWPLLPSHVTCELFAPSSAHVANIDDGSFDISHHHPKPHADDEFVAPMDSKAKEVVMAEYTAYLSSSAQTKEDTESSTAPPQDDYHADFFTMPSPLSKAKFLDVAQVIYQYSSLCLAPFGVLCLNPNVVNTTMLEAKLKASPILQEVVETVSDLVYDLVDLDESTMAMSSQKWLHDSRDADCVAHMQRIQELPQTLLKPPPVVDVTAAPVDEPAVLAMVATIEASIRRTLAAKVPWAVVPAAAAQPLQVVDVTPESPQPISELTWYPCVAYQLGYRFTSSRSNHPKKQSSLQVKAKIQAVFEGIQAALKAQECPTLDAIQLQAVINSVQSDKSTADMNAALASTFSSHHVVNDDVADEQAKPTDDGALAAFGAKLRTGDFSVRRLDDDEAIKRYTEALNCLPVNHTAVVEALTKRAKCYVRTNRLELAAADCKLALDLSPYCADAYAVKGAIDEQHKDFNLALQHHVLAFILGGSRQLDVAEVIERVSKLVGRDQAKSVWANMAKRHELPSSWLVDSYFLSFSRDADAGVSTVHVKSQSKSDDAVSNVLNDDQFDDLLVQAIDHKRSKRYAQAQALFATLAAYVSTTTTTDDEPENLDNVLDGASTTTTSTSTAKKAFKTKRDRHVIALNFHATFLYIAGDVESALAVIDEALALDDTHLNSVVKKAGFLCELGEFEAADECFTHAATVDENSGDVYLHRGQMELIQGDYAAAVSSLRRSMTRCESLAVTHISYAMALYKAGSVYQSVDVFKSALEQFPTSHEVHLFYGDVLSDRADYGLAMEHLKKAVELSPACPLPWLNAGRIFVATNDAGHAIAHFEQALQVDPRCSAAHLDLAQVYFAQGKVERAMEHFDVATTTCRFLPEVEDACACRSVAMMQLKATTILGVELRHLLKSQK